MLPCDGQAICGKGRLSDSSLERLLRFMAVATMVMTIPQVIAVWTRDGGGGARSVGARKGDRSPVSGAVRGIGAESR